MGKLSRTKGASEERRVARGYGEIFPTRDIRRNLNQYQSSDGRDLSGTSPYCVQCKKGKSINVYKAWSEANASLTDEYRIAVAHIYYDRREPIVVLSERDWFGILRLLHGIKL